MPAASASAKGVTAAAGVIAGAGAGAGVAASAGVAAASEAILHLLLLQHNVNQQ